MVQSKIITSAAVRQFCAATSAALITMSSGCWTGWPSPSIPNLIRKDADLVLADEEVSWMVAMMDIGILVTPLLTGYMMDRFGRKKIIMSAGMLLVLSWVLTAVAYSAWFLYTARLLAGLATGISFTVLPVYVGEIASVSIRGAISIMTNLFVWIGISFELTVGPFVSFKVLAFLSLIPPVLLLLTFPFMPESPYYLFMKDRKKDAIEALSWLRGSENTSVKDIVDVKDWVEKNRKSKGRFYDLVSNSGNRHAVFITVGLTVFQRFMGNMCIVAYSSTTLPSTQGVFGPSEAMVVFAGANVLTNLLLTSLVDRWGRVPLLLISAAGTSLVRGFSALYYYLDRETCVDMNPYVWVPYACVILAGIAQPGVGSIPFTLQGELFPISVKSQATALCTITSAITAFLVDKLYVTVDNSLGVYVNYLFFFVNGIICFIFILLFVFETKGKTFTDIQTMLKKSINRGKRTSNNNESAHKVSE